MPYNYLNKRRTEILDFISDYEPPRKKKEVQNEVIKRIREKFKVQLRHYNYVDIESILKDHFAIKPNMYIKLVPLDASKILGAFILNNVYYITDGKTTTLPISERSIVNGIEVAFTNRKIMINLDHRCYYVFVSTISQLRNGRKMDRFVESIKLEPDYIKYEPTRFNRKEFIDSTEKELNNYVDEYKKNPKKFDEILQKKGGLYVYLSNWFK